MDVRISWVIPPDILVTDEFDVFYKVADQANINNWIKANPTPLASTVDYYDITGLDPGTVYRFGVTKSCLGTTSTLSQVTWYNKSCPIIGVYQGAPPIDKASNPTLFYSLYYPDSNHLTGATINILDFTVGNTAATCPSPGDIQAAIVGRLNYATANICAGQFGQYIICSTNKLGLYTNNSSHTSSVGYFGLDVTSTCCPGTSYIPTFCASYGPPTDPILLTRGHTYKFLIGIYIKDPSTSPPEDVNNLTVSSVDNNCADIYGDLLPEFVPINYPPDVTKLSGAMCYDSVTNEISISVKDGTNQTYPNYQYTYFTEDASSNQLPLTQGGNVVTSSDVTYKVFCPINMTPALTPSQLGPGTDVNVFLYDPALNNILSLTGVDFTGFTWANVLTFIANQINVQTTYDASYEVISGVGYIKIAVGSTVTNGYISIGSTFLYAVDLPDISQVNLPGVTEYGITDGFVYNPGSGDFLYGLRGGLGSTTSRIEVTNIAAGTTTEYQHPIDIPANQMTLVPVVPPATAYNLTHLTGTHNSYHGLTLSIVDNPLLWNHGYVYVIAGNSGNTLEVYDQSNTLVDQVTFGNIFRHVEVNQNTGYILTLGESGAPNQIASYYFDHSGIGLWTIINSSNGYSATKVETGIVTGYNLYSVFSSTANSITVIGAPWTNNQFNQWRIQVISGALAGQQAILNYYCPGCNPPITTVSNSNNTLYINTSSLPFNAALLAPGDVFVLLGPATVYTEFYNNIGSFTPDEFVGSDIVIESGPAIGARFKISTNTGDKITLSNLATGTFYSPLAATSPVGYTNLTYNTQYRIYKYCDGQLVYNKVSDLFYYSCGEGQYHVIDGTTGLITGTYTLLDPDSVTLADGAFQFAVHPVTGTAYAIVRDRTSLQDPNTFVHYASPHIYKIASSGLPLEGIDGRSKWNEDISGRISLRVIGPDSYLYFTSETSRKLYRFNVANNTFTTYKVPSIYNKSSATELISGAVHFTGDKFIVMNILDNRTTTIPFGSKYSFANLFVFNISNSTVESVLVGTDSTPYSGPQNLWNATDYGEMFGESNGYKDYGFGGMSIKVFGNKIYFKQYAEQSYYVSEAFAETGVAQIWTVGRNLTSVTNDTYRLVRIWNVQSDGSLQPSVRTLHFYKYNRGNKKGPVYLRYDSFYQSVVGVTERDGCLIVIKPTNLTGYYGGPAASIDSQFTSRLSIRVDTSTAGGITYPTRFTTNNQGIIYIFGRDSVSSGTFRYLGYGQSAVTSGGNTATLTGTTAVGSPPGLYNTGFSRDYVPIYVPSNNEIWMVGNLTPDIPNPTPPPATIDGPLGIYVFNATTMARTHVIDLTGLNATFSGAISFYHNHFYSPGQNALVFRGGNGKIVVINASNKQVSYNDTVTNLINTGRSPVLPAQNTGWVVPYQTDLFIDRSPVGGITEFWVRVGPSSVNFTGNTHNFITIVANGTNILTHDDVYAPTLVGDTFGQWKVTTALPLPGNDVVYWNNIPYAGTITINPFEVIEFTQFSKENKILEVENTTTSTLYSIGDVNYLNVQTYPTFNTLNSIPFFAIKADYVSLNPGDNLVFRFFNPYNPDCPFETNVNVNF